MPRRNSIGLIAVLAAVLLVWLSACGSSEDPAVSLSAGEPEIVSASQLAEFAATAGPVYWLGERSGARYELTETESGRIYVRYLRGDAKAGDPRSSFLTVATYPTEDAVAKLRQASRREGTKLRRTGDGATLLANPPSPSVYLAYPDRDVQIEVYSAVPGQALRLAAAGAVREVE